MAKPSEVLEEQVATIAQAASSLSAYLASPNTDDTFDNLQQCSSLNEVKFQSTRLALIEALGELLETVIGPIEYLTLLVPTSIQLHSALAVIVHFEFAKHVPESSSIAMTDLASKVCLHVDRVRRVLRCAIAHCVFYEEPLGFVHHTPRSRVLLKPGVKAWMAHQFEEMLPASAKLVDSFEMYHDVEDDRETAFSVAFSGNKRSTYWEILEQTPWKVKRFCDALEYITWSGGPGDIRALIGCYDWSKLGGCKLVDVGGSTGRVSIAIAEAAHPEMKFVVQDLPEVEVEANTVIPAKLKDRMSFQPHDFFKPQPVTDARVYLYRQILHDWPDGKAINILKALIPALDPGDYLLLVESVQPDPQTLPNSVDRLIYATDLLMMAKHNAKERTLDMWKQLLKRVDERFVFQSVTAPRDPGHGSIIEIRWVED